MTESTPNAYKITPGEPVKNMYNQSFFDNFTKDLQLVIHNLDPREFVAQVMDSEWENREFKQRSRHITTVLRKFLPADYKQAIAAILELLERVKDTYPDFSEINDNSFGLGLEYGWILDNFVEQYGLSDYETSIRAIEKITQFTSCEFSIRPFIIQYPAQTMAQMLVWSQHAHWGVRRLASEGCRPRLPWAMALPNLKQDPAPILPILETLKNDVSRFVRLSVANNLNDIAKDNPQQVIELAKKWHGASKEINWILKHGSRTLLKQGQPEIMALFGFGDTRHISVENFSLATSEVKIGDSLEFSFNLLNNSDKKANIRLEYALYYQKANGTLAKKVCKISEKEYPAHSGTQITRKHSFRVVTTRKLHLGLHQVAVIVNGNEFEKWDFELI
ncbi:MAG: DNA alkylation repair protein [Dysgonamonadaceae bacterium]|jgi:3-methyladenine DNA glycosylase AlkC|nr:DNA alkylation repair protein [Dysgonamonadaceae bacterium]